MASYRDRADWGTPEEPRGHLIADSLEELHAAAAQIGLTKKHFMGFCLTPHYRLPSALHAEADKIGVRFLTRQEFIRKVTQVQHVLCGSNAKAPTQERKCNPKRPVKKGVTGSLF